MKKKYLVLSLLFIVFFQVMSVNAEIVIADKYLADSGKHLDYDIDSKYVSEFEDAVDIWNNYKSGVIRKDSIFNIQDVAVYDYEDNINSIGGVVNYIDKTLKLNSIVMDRSSNSVKINICAHELGHALGLVHGSRIDIMYYKALGQTYLSNSDKERYDASYNRF